MNPTTNQLELQHFPCCLCGSSRRKTLYPANIPPHLVFSPETFCQSYANNYTLQIVRCMDCGFVFNDPRETPEALANIYSQVEDETYIQELPGKQANFIRNLKTIEKYKQSGMLLDVGCGHGHFLGMADANRWHRIGVEPGSDAAETARSLYNLEVYNTTIGDAPIPPASIDAISMLHVIEHVFDPLELVKQASSFLKPGGIVYIETPDIGSTFARIMGRRWWYIMRFHSHYFSKHSLRFVCQKAGLEVLEVMHPVKTWSIGYLIWRLDTYFHQLSRLATPISRSLGLYNVLINFALGDQIGIVARRTG